MTIRRQMTVTILLATSLSSALLAGNRDDFADRLAMLPGLGSQLTSLPPAEQQFLEHLMFYTTSISTSPEAPASILIKQLSVLECLLDDHFFNPRTPEADGDVLLEMLKILGGLQLDAALELPEAEPSEPVAPDPGDCTVAIRTLESGSRFGEDSNREIVLMSLSEIAHMHANASEEGTFEWTLGPRPGLAENFQILTSEDGRAVSVLPSDSLYRRIQGFPQFRTGVTVTVKFTSATNPERMCEDQIAVNLQYLNPRR